jgi:hypothetical protein
MCEAGAYAEQKASSYDWSPSPEPEEFCSMKILTEEVLQSLRIDSHENK